MIRSGKEILSHFVAGEACPAEELKILNRWLSEEMSRKEIDELFEKEWKKIVDKETSVTFQDVYEKIYSFDTGRKIRGINATPVNFFKLLKVAVIFFISVLLFSVVYFYGKPYFNEQFFETSAPRGQKSQVVLPDGTTIWLNSDSQIKYPLNFGKRNRTVELTGEAWFEVTKNQRKPFIIKTRNLEVKVTGTIFNLRAYSGEPETEATLIEGEIELTMNPGFSENDKKTIKMNPGESLIFNSNKNDVTYSNFKPDEIVGWKNNQLIFRDDSFENLVTKIERWYDVKIICDEPALKTQRLTVELYQGEQLERLLDVIELALHVECKMNGNMIHIKLIE